MKIRQNRLLKNVDILKVLSFLMKPKWIKKPLIIKNKGTPVQPIDDGDRLSRMFFIVKCWRILFWVLLGSKKTRWQWNRKTRIIATPLKKSTFFKWLTNSFCLNREIARAHFRHFKTKAYSEVIKMVYNLTRQATFIPRICWCLSPWMFGR